MSCCRIFVQIVFLFLQFGVKKLNEILCNFLNTVLIIYCLSTDFYADARVLNHFEFYINSFLCSCLQIVFIFHWVVEKNSSFGIKNC